MSTEPTPTTTPPTQPQSVQLPTAEPSMQEKQAAEGEPITDDAGNRYSPGLGPDPWANNTSVRHDAAEAEAEPAPEPQSKSTSKSSDKGGTS